MLKTFMKYTIVIMITASLLILSISFVLNLHMMEAQQLASFHTKIEQVIHTLENNQEELLLMNENLDEDYLTRAKAAAYVLDNQQDMTMDVKQLQYLAALLNVDELHVIDENGIISAASVSKYVGIDMDDHEQTRAFLALLEGEEDAFLIQDAMPNAAEGRIMKYVGVARRSCKGIVQVGFAPTRQLEAESRNTYEYIFSRFPTDVGEELFVVDRENGAVLGHSGGLEGNFDAECYQLDRLLDGEKGIYRQGRSGGEMYVVSRLYGNVLICAAQPGNVLRQKLAKNTISTFLYLLFVEVAVIFLLYYLVKRKVTDGIHDIIGNLTAITMGNLDTAVCVGGNREFEELSRGINAMVRSLVNSSDRISAIIEISGIPLAAFEYQSGKKPVFVTSGFREIMEIPDSTAAVLCGNSAGFGEYIHCITANPIEGEKDVFQISRERYVRIHMSEKPERCIGVITDVSRGVLERQRMQYENTHDALTGLFQYPYFRQRAGEILRDMPPGEVCAVAMLDLDHFKSVNDTYGHNAGDLYLRGFSAVMQSMPEDHFLTARRSGDEFCMMIYGCEDKGRIISFLNLFYEALGKNQVSLTGTHSRIVSASCGFAWTADAGSAISELLARADEALYEMKRGKRGSYVEYGTAEAL